MERPIQCVKDFLTLNLIAGKKLLLALSGGTDSLALLYILLECRHKLDFELHIAHVDHAWREESAEEGRKLSHLCSHLKLPFHFKRLKSIKGSNLEDRYRELRYGFFHELQQKWDFQALLLAHHSDDQGETILKRICEGSRLGALGGLLAKSQRKELTLWRPLLPLRKEELQAFLKKKGIDPFDDVTNRDTHYLRPRMRLQIFPELETHFGKNIGRNFYRLGNLFQEMSHYLEEKKAIIASHLVTGPFGSYLKNPANYPRLELRYFLEETAKAGLGHLSQDSADILLRLIEIEAPKGTIHAGTMSFVLNKGYLFLIQKEMPSFQEFTWKRKVEKGNWESFWQGELPMVSSSYKMISLEEVTPLLRKKLKKWYADHRVPPFLHDKAPLFLSEDESLKECLTGGDLNF